MASEPPVWEELFHQCAVTAYVEAVRVCGGRPESAAVRRRAYALYEAELKGRLSTDKSPHRDDAG